MLQKLFDEGIKKAGNQQKLGKVLNVPQTRISDFRSYPKSGRKPSDTIIAQLALYVGINPIEAVLMCKEETEGKEKATLWKAWLEEYWHPVGDSNPCYRRERAGS